MDFQQSRAVLFARRKRPAVLHPFVQVLLICYLAFVATLNVVFLSTSMRLMVSSEQNDYEDLIMVSNLVLVNSATFAAVLVTYYLVTSKANNYRTRARGSIPMYGNGFGPIPLQSKKANNGIFNLQSVVTEEYMDIKTPEDWKKAAEDFLKDFDSNIDKNCHGSQKEMEKVIRDSVTMFNNMSDPSFFQPMKYPDGKNMHHCVYVDMAGLDPTVEFEVNVPK